MSLQKRRKKERKSGSKGGYFSGQSNLKIDEKSKETGKKRILGDFCTVIINNAYP